MRETDRRVRFTKMILRDSLLRILSEKSITEISVTELCRCADVNRGTFYAHYRQPSDVLTEIEETLISDLHEIMHRSSAIEVMHHEILNCLHENRNVCRVLLSENTNQTFLQRIVDMSMEKFSSTWTVVLDMNEKNLCYLHRFMFAGTAAIICDWIKSDTPTTPDEIAEAIVGIQKRLFNTLKIDPLGR